VAIGPSHHDLKCVMEAGQRHRARHLDTPPDAWVDFEKRDLQFGSDSDHGMFSTTMIPSLAGRKESPKMMIDKSPERELWGTPLVGRRPGLRYHHRGRLAIKKRFPMDGPEPNRPQPSETGWLQPKEDVQLALVTVAYAGILISWGTVFYNHHLQTIAESNTSGGIYAFSGSASHVFHACLLMIPTFFLIRMMSKFEAVYTTYSKFLFWFSVSSPVCVAVLLVPSLAKTFGNISLIRLMASPFVLVGIGIRQWMARSDLAKKLTIWALLIEGVALVIGVVLFFVG
jgi:hypothetical protein